MPKLLNSYNPKFYIKPPPSPTLNAGLWTDNTINNGMTVTDMGNHIRFIGRTVSAGGGRNINTYCVAYPGANRTTVFGYTINRIWGKQHAIWGTCLRSAAGRLLRLEHWTADGYNTTSDQVGNGRLTLIEYFSAPSGIPSQATRIASNFRGMHNSANIYHRYRDDNTNIYFDISSDGVNWLNYWSVGRTNAFNNDGNLPTLIGMGIECLNGNVSAGLNMLDISLIHYDSYAGSSF